MTDDAIVHYDARQHITATRARNDAEMIDSWLSSMGSPITRSRFATTAKVFMEILGRRGLTLRDMAVEDMRDCLDELTAGKATSSSLQYMARIKGLISYAHKLGYLQFNAGAPIKRPPYNSELAQRILTETQVALLVRAAPTPRDGLLIEVGYASALRISELTGLVWGNAIERDEGAAQLSVLGKGGKVRQVILPPRIGAKLLKTRNGAPDSAYMFATRRGTKLLPREVNRMLKKAARKAGLKDTVSAHWLRHAHASHALARGSTVADVKDMLGHSNVATTSAYLHARPDRSSAYALDQGIFTEDEE